MFIPSLSLLVTFALRIFYRQMAVMKQKEIPQ